MAWAKVRRVTDLEELGNAIPAFGPLLRFALIFGARVDSFEVGIKAFGVHLYLCQELEQLRRLFESLPNQSQQILDVLKPVLHVLGVANGVSLLSRLQRKHQRVLADNTDWRELHADRAAAIMCI